MSPAPGGGARTDCRYFNCTVWFTVLPPSALAVALAAPAANLPLAGVTVTVHAVAPLQETLVLPFPLIVVVFFPFVCVWLRATLTVSEGFCRAVSSA